MAPTTLICHSSAPHGPHPEQCCSTAQAPSSFAPAEQCTAAIARPSCCVSLRFSGTKFLGSTSVIGSFLTVSKSSSRLNKSNMFCCSSLICLTEGDRRERKR